MMRWQQHITIGAVILLILLAALPILTYPLGRDQAMYANIGQSILAGGTPYQTMWDIKPPPIYYLYAAGIAIFGTHWGAIRALDLVAFPVGALGLYLIGLHLAQRRVGVWAAFLYGIFYFTETFASLTQNDSLVGVLMIWAAFATLKAGAANRQAARRWAFLAGLCCGLIVWFKHYFAFFVLALAIFHLWRWLISKFYDDNIPAPSPSPLRKEGNLTPPLLQERGQGGEVKAESGRGGEDRIQRGGRGLRLVWEVGAFCLGGLLTGGGLLVYFGSLGMVEAMLIVAQGTAAYNALGYDFNAFLAAMQNYLYFRWRHWGALVVILLFGAAVRAFQYFSGSVFQRVSPSAGQPSVLSPQHILIYLWLLSGVAFLLIQAKGFDTHWLPLLPPLVLLAAISLDNSVKIVGKGREKPYFLYGLHSILVVGLALILLSNTWLRALPYLTGQETLVEYYARFPEGGDLNPVHSVQIVDYLRPTLAVGDSIYIWGFRPEVAYMGGWRPATRFQAQFPLVAAWFPAAWQQENVDTLWAAMPPVVLVLQGDYMPWVTGSHEDSHQLLVRYTELSHWLAANYDRDTTLGSFIVWKKKPS